MFDTFEQLWCAYATAKLFPLSDDQTTHHTQLRDFVQKKAREKKWSEEETRMRAQFQQRQALTEQTVVDRKVLADNNIIRINKETRQKIKGAESEWQGQAAKWVATARRKVTTSQPSKGSFSSCLSTRAAPR